MRADIHAAAMAPKEKEELEPTVADEEDDSGVLSPDGLRMRAFTGPRMPCSAFPMAWIVVNRRPALFGCCCAYQLAS